MKRTAVLALSFVLAACDLLSQADRQAPSACDVAASYVGVLIKDEGRPVVFSDEDDPSFQYVSGGQWITIHNDRPKDAVGPPASLLSGMDTAGSTNAVNRCESVRKTLERQQVPFGLAATDAASRVGEDGLFAASIMTVSLPTVSEDGQSAILVVGRGAGPLVGGTTLHYVRRHPDGEWRFVSFYPLTVG